MRRVLFLILCLLIHLGAYGSSYNPKIPTEYEVLSLSAAIIDHYYFITDDHLKSITDEKGGWAPIDRKTLFSIFILGFSHVLFSYFKRKNKDQHPKLSAN